MTCPRKQRRLHTLQLHAESLEYEYTCITSAIPATAAGITMNRNAGDAGNGKSNSVVSPFLHWAPRKIATSLFR